MSALGRRAALTRLAALLAASPALRSQAPPRPAWQDPRRATPLDQLASAHQLEPMARRALSAAAFERIAGGEREALDRITFRPRMMVNTLGLDLSVRLLGQRMLAPILVGPASGQHLVHPAGESGTAEGAAAAEALIVTAEHSGTPVDAAGAAGAGAWHQLYPDSDAGAVAARAQRAREAGRQAICLTLGSPGPGGGAARSSSWDQLERLREAAGIPVVLKGVMRPAEAVAAADHGMSAVIVSNHGAGRAAGLVEPAAALPQVADALEGRIPVLVDGGFRRGGDILKALALGASAVLVCRPALWGLAAYGPAGVRKVIEMLQTELAQDMVQVGAASPAEVRRDHVRIHSR